MLILFLCGLSSVSILFDFKSCIWICLYQRLLLSLKSRITGDMIRRTSSGPTYRGASFALIPFVLLDSVFFFSTPSHQFEVSRRGGAGYTDVLVGEMRGSILSVLLRTRPLIVTRRVREYPGKGGERAGFGRKLSVVVQERGGVSGGLVNSGVVGKAELRQFFIPSAVIFFYVLRDHCFHGAVCPLYGVTMRGADGGDAMLYFILL